MSQEQDKVFFRNFTLVVGILAVMMVVFYIAASMSGSDPEADMKMREESVAKMTAPIGDVVAEGEEVAEEASEEASEEVAAGPVDGAAVYNGLCVACHSVDGIGAPVVGKADQWTDRISKGMDALYANAINGYVGPQGYMMPARGGGQNTDEEVKAAVDYMVEQSQ